MQPLIVDILFGFLLSPWVTDRAVSNMVRYADPQSPTYWKAVSAGVVATISIMFGLIFGAGAAGALAGLLNSNTAISFLVGLVGGLLSLVLNFWRVLLVYNRTRGTLPD